MVTDTAEFEAALDAIALDPSSDHSITIDGDVDLTGFTTPVGGAGTITILNGAGTLTGAGGLIKQGAGALTITGAHLNTGDTSLSAGTVRLENDAALGSGEANTTGAVIIDYANGVNIGNGLVLSSDPTLNVAVGTATQAGNITRSSGIGSDNGITKTGAGTLVLSGTNDLNDLTSVNAGTLRLVGGDAIGDSGHVSVAAGATLALEDSEVVGSIGGAGSIDLGDNLLSYFGASNQTFSGVISGVGGSFRKSGNGTLTLSGANTYDGGTLIAGTTGLVLGNDSALGTGGLSTTGSSGTLGYASGVVIDNTIQIQTATNLSVAAGSAEQAGAISGGIVRKTGAGTLTLSGANTHTGATQINAGTLAVSGGAAIVDTGAVTIASGATFALDADETVGSVSGAGNITLGGTLTAGGDNTSTTVSGIISGAGGLTKAGSGTLTLSGVNTYTGATNINAGTLAISGGSAIANTGAVTIASGATFAVNAIETVGSISGAGNITLGAALTAGGDNTTTTVSGIISGAGGLTKEGSGTLTLSGENTYTGETQINAGTLAVSGSFAIADMSAVIIASGASLALNANETVGSISGAGNITLGGTLTAGGNNTTTTLSGDISGAGGLTKTGAGTLLLTGVNTNTGLIDVNEGALAISGGAAISDASDVYVAEDATFAVIDAETVASIYGAGDITLGATLTTLEDSFTGFFGTVSGVGGLNQNGSGRLILFGENTYSGLTSVNAGTLELAGGQAIADSNAVIVSSGGTLEIQTSETIGSLAGAGAVAISNHQTLTVGGANTTTEFAGVISGHSFEKVGSGVLTLSGANTYTGETRVNGGTLALSGGNAISDLSAVTINAGGALALNDNETVGALAGSGQIDLGSNRLTAGGADATTYSGVISGSGGLTYAGSSELTLTGVNTYTGDTIITSGRLALGNTQAIADTSDVFIGSAGTLFLTETTEHVTVGSLQGAGVVLVNDNFIVAGANGSDFTFDGTISGSLLGGLRKIGAGNMTLTGVNQGRTEIDEGTLTLSGTVLHFNPHRVVVDSDARLVLETSADLGGLQGAGTVVLGDHNLGVGAGVPEQSSAFSGSIEGAGGLYKFGTGTFLLDGVNTYTGPTTVTAGELVLEGGNALSDVGLLTLFHSATCPGSHLEPCPTVTVRTSERVGAISGGGVIEIFGANTLTAGDASDTIYSGQIRNTGSFTKMGAGRLTLEGANTYSGGTTIEAGALQVGSGGTSGRSWAMWSITASWPSTARTA